MEQFDPQKLQPGRRETFRLPVMDLPDGAELWLPVLTACGNNDGPTLIVLAGVHGDEYEGIHAIPQVFQRFDPAALHGRLIAVPVCNVPAYRVAKRTSPIDGLNLARVFPGNPDGTVTERIAHVLTEQIIRQGDLLIDLHSSGAIASMPTLVGYPYANTPLGQAAQAAAYAFGCRVIWGHPPDPHATGRSISAAEMFGIPWIYTEATGGLRTRPEDVEAYIRGILNVMRSLGMLAGEPEIEPLEYHLLGSGNTDKPICAKHSGYFVPSVRELDAVVAGQLLGVILDITGEPIEEIHAERDGRIVMMRTLPVIHAGEGVFMITGEVPA